MAAGSEQKQYHTGGWSAHYVMIVCTLLFVINYMTGRCSRLYCSR
jgi:hypothetical protein